MTSTSTPSFIDPFNAFQTLTIGTKTYGWYRLAALEEAGLVTLSKLPFSTRILLESILRNVDGFEVTEDDVKKLAAWNPTDVTASIDIPFKPGRVILQDFTGVPAVVDLAAMRSAMQRLGGDPAKINPLIPADLVIDHSVQTDYFGTPDALRKNVELEFHRNRERYALLRWARKSMDNFSVVPPSVGIIHQVNLEYLGRVVMTGESRQPGVDAVLYPDSVLGTDSHTVMINGLGVLGWGVGGIEAEAVMLGCPYYMLVPQVIGVELIGQTASNVTATDIVLTLTEMLRKEGVVGKFVEFFGEGASRLPVADRAVLANMAPEYGATMGYFPVDDRTIEYLNATGRTAGNESLCPGAEVVETYMKAQGLFRTADAPVPCYTKTLQLDLSKVEPSLAGPKRPQDRIPLAQLSEKLRAALPAGIERTGKSSGSAASSDDLSGLDHGSVVIAAITSCTNTSNPNLMIAAGLLAQKAAARGMKVKPWVKTSLGPGSRVVTDYLEKAGLLDSLAKLGFNVVGYGCLTCIGNSGPLPEEVAKKVVEKDLFVSAVLSGNRNFEGRINPLVKGNFLASPPLVVAFALAGTTDIDLTTEPVGTDSEGKPVMLSEIFPDKTEIEAIAKTALDSKLYSERYSNVYESKEFESQGGAGADQNVLFDWDRASTYIQEPPFLTSMGVEPDVVEPITGARVLLKLGNSVTTDHISPAGAIKPGSPAAQYLEEHGVARADFNSYGSRRGNDRVMTRGTFANIRLRNLLLPGTEGGVTKYFAQNAEEKDIETTVFDAAVKYVEEKVPLIVLAGAEYGTGSSRDWAAKGTALLGIRAVIAESFERIHRGNLVGMGILPLEFLPGQSVESLGLTGTELFSIQPVGTDFVPQGELKVVATATADDAPWKQMEFKVRTRIDTPVELQYYLNGGIIPFVLRKLL